MRVLTGARRLPIDGPNTELSVSKAIACMAGLCCIVRIRLSMMDVRHSPRGTGYPLKSRINEQTVTVTGNATAKFSPMK